MKTILYSILSLLTYSVYGQDTSYYDSKSAVMLTKDSFSFFTVIQRDILDSNKVSEKSFFKSGQLKKEEYYSTVTKHKTYEGAPKEYYENGQLRRLIPYLNGSYHGNFTTYWNNGIMKRMDVYN